MIRFGIQILNYNGSRWMPGILDSLENCSYPEKRVYIVDNGSTDDSLQIARDSELPLEVIENGSNFGFAGAYNQSANAAWRDDCDWLCLLNTDILVCPGWLENVAEVVEENERIGIAGPVHWAWDEDTPSPFMRRRYPEELEQLLTGAEHISVDWIEGSCLFVSRACWESVKGLDARYFFYWEDADLCRRARKNGWLVELVANSHIRHYGGGSSAALEAVANPLKQRYHFLYKLSDPNHGMLSNFGSWLRMLITIGGDILVRPGRLRRLWITLANVGWTVCHAGMIFRKWRGDKIASVASTQKNQT
ncbi:MAG: glycosyltransferase family 2 protein [Alphaproteobacteria bacterium]|nr:MAG: glycosyltransferase family 2 protein [Alphaproteobacteria bacterium]